MKGKERDRFMRAVPNYAHQMESKPRLPMDKTDYPKVLAVVPLPTAQERRRREVTLARLMLVAIDLVLSGEGLGLEVARDLGRELRHAYPELVDEYL